MTGPPLRLRVAEDLRFFLGVRHRRAEEAEVNHDGTASLGHVVQSIGVPLTEVGGLLSGGRPVGPAYRPSAGETIDVRAVQRPQQVPSVPASASCCDSAAGRVSASGSAAGPRSQSFPGFVLDVHLGALARRLRLVGVDTAYRNDACDDELLNQANAERRILLTQDRGLLRRRSLWFAGYVRGARPDPQLLDVLGRFAPPLAPWSRCMACNGVLIPVGKAEIADLIRPGTRRTYDTFERCPDCGRVYWRGAHSARLEATVESALSVRQAMDAPRDTR